MGGCLKPLEIQNMSATILRLPAVKSESGLSRSTIYSHIKQNLFTRPILISQRAVGWPANEVEAINAARITGKTDEEIRGLVVELEAARKTCGVKEAA